MCGRLTRQVLRTSAAYKCCVQVFWAVERICAIATHRLVVAENRPKTLAQAEFISAEHWKGKGLPTNRDWMGIAARNAAIAMRDDIARFVTIV